MGKKRSSTLVNFEMAKSFMITRFKRCGINEKIVTHAKDTHFISLKQGKSSTPDVNYIWWKMKYHPVWKDAPLGNILKQEVEKWQEHVNSYFSRVFKKFCIRMPWQNPGKHMMYDFRTKSMEVAWGGRREYHH